MTLESAQLTSALPVHFIAVHYLSKLDKHSADPNQATDVEFTPLYIAETNGHVMVVELLVKYNANVK